MSSKRTTTHDRVEHTGAQGTSFSGATVHLAAGQDLAVVGSHVASDRATTLVAGRDVTIQAATETLHEHHFKETKKSGLFS
ncbi:hemagglutinin repeat-containing protein, partial [Escherichia coli]|nr:hemagglutinin repeat-containing protein [Escherichia coli]